MKIRLLFSIFLFICILVSGCGKKIPNSRAEFQEIASKVEMDIDPANVSEFEMYLPKGYIEYIPDSREYKKTTVTLPSGKEKEVICPYAQQGYKKNELEEWAEGIDKSIQNRNSNQHSNENSLDKNSKVFINKDKKILVYALHIPAIKESKVNFVFDKLIDYSFKSMKDSMKKNYSTMQEYDFSSSFSEIDFIYYCDKKEKDSPNYFNLASVRTSTGSAVFFSFQFDKDEKNDIIATLLSIKPASSKPVKYDSDKSVKSDLDSESKENK